MRQTTIDSQVLIILEGKPVKGTVAEVFSPGAARIALGGDKGTVQATYSDKGEEGTFHYPDEAKTVKESDTFGEQPQPETSAAEEAPANGKAVKKK